MITLESMKNEYNKSKKHSCDIMDEISSVLNKKNISHTINTSKTEIVVKSTKHSKSFIKSLITDNVCKPEAVVSLLINITDVGDTIYIRQVSK